MSLLPLRESERRLVVPLVVAMVGFAVMLSGLADRVIVPFCALFGWIVGRLFSDDAA